MRILLIHANSFSFHVTGETSVALPAELDKAGSEGNVDEALVAFMAAEKGDDKTHKMWWSIHMPIFQVCLVPRVLL
ncbi:MAG: hypothetical protein JRF28_06595 [Deltaproteobacteria bacterium]|nr:hypothetical protein [Deltaproteobacteria bacterium]